MKTLTRYVPAALLCFCSVIVNAQSPCSGTPSANSILPSPNFTICAGTSATLSLANTYSNSGITLQWQSSTTSSVGPFTGIFGAGEVQYVTPVIHNTYYYNVVITCTNSGISINVPVTVSVVPCYTPCSGTPSNTITPASQTLCAGNSASLSMTGSVLYMTGYVFQWQASGSSAGSYTAVPGASLSSLVSPTLNSTTYYNAVITCTNSGGSYTTSPVAVHVTTCSACSSAPAFNPIIGPDTVCAGTIVTLGLTNTYSNTGISYQWSTSNVSVVGPWSPVSGAVAPTFTSSQLFANAFFYITVTCTNTSSQTSMVHSVAVIPCATPCSGTPQATSIVPASATVCAGSQATLSLANSYSASSGISFQWYSSTVSSGPFTPLTGATQNTYTTMSLTNSTYYQAVITCSNGGQSYTTAPVLITVNSCTFCSGVPPSNTIVPASTTVCAGNSITLSLAQSYTASGYAYQWYASATSSAGPWSQLTGATGTSYATPPLNNSTFFSIVITCTNSGQTSTFYSTVTVFSCTACTGTPTPNSILPATSTVCTGASVSLSLAATYTNTGYSYQWQSSSASISGPWTPVAGANGVAYTTPSLTSASYYFSIVVTCTNSGASAVFATSFQVLPCNTVGNGESGAPFYSLRIIPNPSLGYFSVHSVPAIDGHLSVTDIAGRALLNISVENGAASFSIGHLPPGIYIARFTSAAGARAVRLIRE